MGKNRIKYFVVIVVIALTACSISKSGESPDFDLQSGRYVKKIKQYRFTLTPVSAEKMASINYAENTSGAMRDSALTQYENYLCFLLEINIDGFTGDISEYDELGGETNFDKKVNYYLFDMQNSLNLKNDKGLQSPCTIYYHEQLNELTRSNRFFIGFKKPEGQSSILEYTNPYFNCGKINIGINNNLALK